MIKYYYNSKVLKENVDLNEYGVRFSVNEEKEITNFENMLNNSNNKTFRLKNRYEIFTEDGLIRYDLTQVRQYNGKSFKKINPDKLNRTYEIEMEILNPDKFNQMNTLTNSLLKNIYMILRIIRSNNVLGKSKINSVINNYKKMVKIINQINKKIILLLLIQ